jgi:Bacterial toxin 24
MIGKNFASTDRLECQVALRILCGELGIVEGVRALHCAVENDEKLAVSEPFMLLRAVDSEVNAFTPVESRSLYSSEYLAAEDKQLALFITKVRDDVFALCRMILENNAGPDSNAEGSHSTFRQDSAGAIIGYHTWGERGEPVQRTDMTNKKYEGVDMPHSHFFVALNVNSHEKVFRGNELRVRATPLNEIPRCGIAKMASVPSKMEFGFHDCLVNGFRWHDRKKFFVIYLQYIAKWIAPTAEAENYRFEIAAAELTFKNTSETMLSFNWGLWVLSARMDGIVVTESRPTASGVVEHHYRIDFAFPRAFVSFWSTGFELTLLHDPILCEHQRLPVSDE